MNGWKKYTFTLHYSSPVHCVGHVLSKVHSMWYYWKRERERERERERKKEKEKESKSTMDTNNRCGHFKLVFAHLQGELYIYIYICVCVCVCVDFKVTLYTINFNIQLTYHWHKSFLKLLICIHSCSLVPWKTGKLENWLHLKESFVPATFLNTPESKWIKSNPTESPSLWPFSHPVKVV